MKLLKAGKFLQQNKQSEYDVTRKLYYDVPSENQREKYLLQLKTDSNSPICHLTRTSCYHKYVRHRSNDEIYKKEDRTIKQKSSKLQHTIANDSSS